MAASFPLRWTERALFLTLILSILLKVFHPVIGLPLSFSSWLFKLSVALLFFFYIAWPWLFAPPLQKSERWDRILHFTAPLAWAYDLLAILLARSVPFLMGYEAVKTFYSFTSGPLGLFVLILAIQRIHYAESKAATRYYGWIIGRHFIIGILAQMATEIFGIWDQIPLHIGIPMPFL
ncbi:MAG: hypothetical protein ABEH38_09170 [Flavobacteriales bacterium]